MFLSRQSDPALLLVRFYLFPEILPFPVSEKHVVLAEASLQGHEVDREAERGVRLSLLRDEILVLGVDQVTD